MRLKVAGTPDPKWDKWLTELDGNIYDSVGWAESECTGTKRPLYFSWVDDSNRISAIAVGIANHSSFPVLGRFSRHLEFGTHPAFHIDSGNINHELIPQIRRYARRRGFNSLEVGSFYADPSDACLRLEGFRKTGRLEFVIDLTVSDEQLERNLSTNHRRKLKKARKETLQHEVGRNLQAMKVLVSLKVRSRERRISRGEEMAPIGDARVEEFGQAYFDRRLGEVHYLTHKSSPVSAAFVSIHNGKAYYVFGGSSDSGFAMNAPVLLFMNIFAHCRTVGCREFNLGGVPGAAVGESSQSHGLYRFKAGFGGEEVPCFSLRADDLQPVGGPLLRLLRRMMPRR